MTIDPNELPVRTADELADDYEARLLARGGSYPCRGEHRMTAPYLLRLHDRYEVRRHCEVCGGWERV